MKINCNVTGTERKSLVSVIRQELNATCKYCGAPTFAYEVGGYTIDKVGTVTGPDNPSLEITLSKAGFGADDKPDEVYNPVSAEISDEEWAEREIRRMKLEAEKVPDYSNRGPYGGGDIPESRAYQAELSDPDWPERMEVFSADNDEDALQQAYEFCEDEVRLLELYELDSDYNRVRPVQITPRTDRLTIEVPLDGFTPEKLDNLFKLVNAKDALLKAALGAENLPIKQTADTLQFPWFRGKTAIDADHAEAYAALVGLLCKTAMDKKRVTAKEKAAEGSPKYAMRCFLLSLGFIGDEYKKARKILLSRLEGNSSWKNGKKTEVSHDDVSE